jgi:hypothetical protein
MLFPRRGVVFAHGEDEEAAAGQDLSPEQHLRWWRDDGERELRQLLFWRWDPIQVADAFPYTEGEYDDYTVTVLKALRSGEDVRAVLLSIEREWMGGQMSTDEHLDHVAGLLVDWFGSSTAGWLEFRYRAG